MIGHIALFIAALVAAAAAALSFPSRTGSEAFPAAVQTSLNLQGRDVASSRGCARSARSREAARRAGPRLSLYPLSSLAADVAAASSGLSRMTCSHPCNRTGSCITTYATS